MSLIVSGIDQDFLCQGEGMIPDYASSSSYEKKKKKTLNYQEL